MSIDVKAMMEQVNAEIARRRGCAGHRFQAQATYQLGAKLTCEVCGASMRLTDIGTYARGYSAAGGNPDDILPGLIPAPQGETPGQRGVHRARELLSEWLETPNEGDAMVDCLLGVIREAHTALGGSA